MSQKPAAVLLLAALAGCASKETPVRPRRESELRVARAKGTREAEAAISAGRLTRMEYPPLPSRPGHGEYVQLLREKCGVG
jgi:hypothetical protein